LLLSNPKRLMSALARTLLFAQSQAHEMHFKTQHALLVQGTATFRKFKLLPCVEGLTCRVECRESHPPDTDSRLLADTRRSPKASGRPGDPERNTSGHESSGYTGLFRMAT
jgi:hypothetical protein